MLAKEDFTNMTHEQARVCRSKAQKEFTSLDWGRSFGKLELYAMGKINCLDTHDARILTQVISTLFRLYMSEVKDVELAYYEQKERVNRPWTKEDDELLIEMASSDGFSTISMAMELGRTPETVKTRISKLVGRKRQSKPVDGIFKGIMKTDDSGETEIKGRVYEH